MNAQQWSKIMFLAGRLFVGVMYLGAGINHLVELRETAGHTASKGVIALRALVTMASTILIIAGFCFITGLVPRAGLLAIVLFLIPVTLIIHNFWAYGGMQREIEMHAFLGNMGLFDSALMFLAIPDP